MNDERVREMLEWTRSQRPYIVAIELLGIMMVAWGLSHILMQRLSYSTWPTMAIVAVATIAWIGSFRYAVGMFTYHLFNKEDDSDGRSEG